MRPANCNVTDDGHDDIWVAIIEIQMFYSCEKKAVASILTVVIDDDNRRDENSDVPWNRYGIPRSARNASWGSRTSSFHRTPARKVKLDTSERHSFISNKSDSSPPWNCRRRWKLFRVLRSPDTRPQEVREPEFSFCDETLIARIHLLER